MRFLLVLLITVMTASISAASLPSEVDAVILGTGPAAVTIGAVLTQEGKRVLLVDSYGITGGAVATHLELRHQPIDQQSPRIMRELNEYLLTADPFHPAATPEMWHCEWIKHAMDALIERYEIPLLLHSLPQELLLADNHCAGIVIRLKNGTHTVSTPVVIDCTDQQRVRYLFEGADVARPMKAVFRLRVDDVESGAKETSWKVSNPLNEGEMELNVTPVAWDARERLLELSGVIKLDTFSTVGISQAEITMRSLMGEQLSKLKKDIPGFDKAVPVQSSVETALFFTEPAQTIPAGVYLIGDSSPNGDFNMPAAIALAEQLCHDSKSFILPKSPSSPAIAPPPESLDADIVVIGGGTAGLTASLKARINGDKVVLIEQYPFFGGTMVASGVAQGASPILRLLSTLGATEHKNWGTFNKEVMKSVLQTLVLKSGVRALLSSQVYDATVKDGRIEAVTLLNRHGRKCTVRGRVFLDCTGDGDVAVAAGAEFFTGNRSRHATQPVGMLYSWRWLGENAAKNPIGGNISGANVDANALDSLDMTFAEIAGRKNIMQAYRNYNSAYKGQMKMIASPPQSGVRQTRQIVGDYILTVRDLYEDIPFPDTVARCPYLIDVQGEYVEAVKPFAIPYRILLVKGLKNLLMAGRHISMSHEVMGAVRYQAVLMNLGKIVGTAAAESLKVGDDPRSVNVRQVMDKSNQNEDFYSKIYFQDAPSP